MDTFDVYFYAIVSAKVEGEGKDARLPFKPKPAVRTTMNKPSLAPNEVPVRIKLTLPLALFMRPALEATITVPEGQPIQNIITADVKNNLAEQIRRATGFEVKLSVDMPEE